MARFANFFAMRSVLLVFQQGLGEQAVTCERALCTCWMWSPSSLKIGKFGTCIGVRGQKSAEDRYTFQ